jgi:hypothetical protein
MLQRLKLILANPDEWSSRLPTPRSWVWLAGIACAGFLGFYWDSGKEKQSGATEPEAFESASTLIPAGFVLVPIEVSNYESLDSILGKFGIVDLYTPPEKPGGKPIKAAEHVKILRAPLNPNHFAVMVHENESARLVSFNGSFTVIVLNPNLAGTNLVNTLGVDNNRSLEVHHETRVAHSRITVEVPDVKKED